MAEQGPTQQPPGNPSRGEMIPTGPAAEICGVDPRTMERWVDQGKINGGRPTDPVTRQPIKGSHRWVDVRHAVAIAEFSNRAHLVPPRWRHLLSSRAA